MSGNGEVLEIVRLEGQAAKADKNVSADRWRAAQLIHGQLEHKTYRQLSADIKAAGGKGSIGHLERMNKCWQLIGQMNWDSYGKQFESYPDFTSIYQSDEVRGGEGESEPGGSGQRKRRSGEEYDLQEILRNLSASGLANCMATCCESLASHPAFWQHLTDDDLASLAMVRDQICTIIRGSAKLSAQLTQRIQGMNGLSALAAVPFRVKPNYE